jgi:tetratricopeptide (TPR) repeat protein
MVLGGIIQIAHIPRNRIKFVNSCRKMEPDRMGIFEIQLDWDIGRIYINDGKYDNATRIFKAISKFSPVTSALALGEIYGKENNPEKAFIAFSRAIFLDNQSAAAWRNRGMALLELKRYNEALDSCNKSLNLTNETDAEAWFSQTAAAHPAASRRGMRGAAA